MILLTLLASLIAIMLAILADKPRTTAVCVAVFLVMIPVGLAFGAG